MTVRSGPTAAILVAIVILTGATMGLFSFAIPVFSADLRLGLAALITVSLGLTSLRYPQGAVLLTLAFLPTLALIRRLVIPLAGWSSYDPLLLIAPLVCIVLVHRLFVLEKRPIARDSYSKLVLGLIGLSVVEVFNPAGGGANAGAVGLLFLAAPLLWFFVGREVSDREMVNAVLVLTVVEGAAIAAYGLLQTGVGFPSWDDAWVRLNGYGALNVALGTVRAFGTFSSAAEYATFLAIALTISLVGLLHRKMIGVLVLPLLGYALFLESSRGIVVLVLLAMVVILGMRTGSIGFTLVSITLATLGAVATIHFFGAQLSAVALRSDNPLVAHQVAGLLNPLDPQQSTFQAHQSQAIEGVVGSLSHPLGLGTGATNLATRSAGTDFDVSNAFVSLGLAGGVVFTVVVLATFWRIGKMALTNRDVQSLAVVGVLLVTLGQWLNGGYYAIAPLVWFLIGSATRRWLEEHKQSPATTSSATRMQRWGLAPVAQEGRISLIGRSFKASKTDLIRNFRKSSAENLW